MKGIAAKTQNPCNLRHNSRNEWVGQVGEYRGFCMFKNVAYGFRAAYKTLCSYIRNDVRTIEDIIRRWAPPCENNTDSYVKFVADDCMIDKDAPLTNVSIHDYWTIIIILRAMARLECGEWFDEQQINLMINYPEKY